jgi:virulence factor Mce-like protein
VRRAIAAAAVLVVAGVLVLAGGGNGTAGSYRVAAVFDTARGMVPGQLVKVAGARVGKVTDVRLAPGPAARIEMKIEARFGPFGADARCRILPEGFISEHYVECDPGSGAPLARGSGGLPTIPLDRTEVPLGLQDVLNVFGAPTPQRMQVLYTELGLGLAGRGAELNGVLRRANPALDQTRRVLRVLGDENQRIETAVQATDTVLARLARQREDVRRFISTTAAVTRTTADRKEALAETVRELPSTLTAIEDGLRSIRRVAVAALPTLDRLRAAAPGLAAATTTIPAFTAAAGPAVAALRSTAHRARPVVRTARVPVRRLAELGATAEDVLPALDDLAVDLQRTGGVEALLNLPYRLATMSAAHDSVSHMASVFVGFHPRCLADPTAVGCSHAYSAAGQGTIPVNAPGAGPQPAPDTVSTAVVGGRAAPARLTQRTSRDLLDWLLK